MKNSLSGSTYILLTAKYLTHIDTLLKLSNTQMKKIDVPVRPYDKKAFLSGGFVLFSFS